MKVWAFWGFGHISSTDTNKCIYRRGPPPVVTLERETTNGDSSARIKIEAESLVRRHEVRPLAGDESIHQTTTCTVNENEKTIN